MILPFWTPLKLPIGNFRCLFMGMPRRKPMPRIGGGPGGMPIMCGGGGRIPGGGGRMPGRGGGILGHGPIILGGIIGPRGRRGGTPRGGSARMFGGPIIGRMPIGPPRFGGKGPRGLIIGGLLNGVKLPFNGRRGSGCLGLPKPFL